MKKIFIALAIANMLGGCAGFKEQPPPPLTNKVTVTIELVDKIPGAPYLVNGRIRKQPDGTYYIYIEPDGYPYCITHEILHAFNWDWHKGRTSAEFCHSE